MVAKAAPGLVTSAHSGQDATAQAPISPIDDTNTTTTSTRDVKGSAQHVSEKRGHARTFVELHPHQTQLAKAFKSRWQLSKMLFENAIKWFIGVVILLFLFATLKVFENKGNTEEKNKRWFNVIITALNIALGINFFSALGDLAKILRWRVLAETPHSMRDVDLILSADSLSKLASLSVRYYKLGLKKIFRKNKAHAHGEEKTSSRSAGSFILSASKISLWLLLNLVAQAVIALIGLTYGYESGSLVFPPPNGPTFESDISHFDTLWSTTAPNGVHSEQEAAHVLGDIAASFDATNVNHRRDFATFNNSEKYYFIPEYSNPNWFNDLVGRTWIYRYFNYDASVFNAYTYAVPTSKTINATWDHCFRYPVVSGAGLDDSFANITYVENGVHLNLLVDIVGKSTTTYIYPGPDEAVCYYNRGDPRCSKVWAFQQPWEGNPPWVYMCEITVGHIIDDDDSKQVPDLADTQAGYAAAAVGLSGFGTTQSKYVATGKTTGAQFQRYAYDQWWSLAGNRSNNFAGSMMAQFSIATLAAQAEYNFKRPAIGPTAIVGVILRVEWWALRLLLPIIAFAHFVLFVVAVILANPYVVRDDSNLANAQLFAPMLKRAGLGLGGSGSYLTGEEIAELCDAGLDRREVVYGIKVSDLQAAQDDVESASDSSNVQQPAPTDGRDQAGNTYWLGLAEDIEVQKRRKFSLARTHSDGLYM